MKRAISFSFAAILMTVSSQIHAQEVAQKNIKPVSNALQMLAKLEPVTFSYDEAWAQKLRLPLTTQYGFVGVDAKSALPDLVTVRAKNYGVGKNASRSATLTKVDYESLIPLLVGSIKEQQQQIDALKRELNMLKGQNAK
ncbi:tail fiber domain-containing protein [Pedobacter sandarakinus]|uniref:tail fiber domain-containing protein n=1 Tax=Pedobacter sandarakinus TaxID=353156 RepID=UPI00224500A4|nr:tail fiber domain-containing protein [Pedobacter sandarakinus]MCX2573352.1 tail fiber domain-containing protein [Pedobacter sandarakinus]